MKQSYLLIVVLVALLCNSYYLSAFHIVGGEMTYECLGGTNYRITLTVYRDCLGGGAEFDDPAYIFIFTQSGTLVNQLNISFSEANDIDPPTNICVTTLPDVCVEQTTYSILLSLPSVPGGYELVYQRYSRNSTIVNIVAPDETGSTYSTSIPSSDVSVCNTSPVFNTFPPTVICANTPMAISQAASDADGDSLVYEFCDPLIGGTGTCFQPGNPDPAYCFPPGAPASSPPHASVTWGTDYSADYPMDASPALSIDPQTGLITGTPTAVGQYVVAICVSEYRNGEFISYIRRDFQFNVTPCQAVTASVQADEVLPTGEYIITDCNDDFTVNFINTTIGANSYYWDFGDTTTPDDFSMLENPSYAYPDSGQYVVTLIGYVSDIACTDTATILLNLYPTLNNDFNYSIDCADVPVQFTDISTTTYGNIDSWLWAFNDGNFSDEQNPAHTYEMGGDYLVTLSTSTDLGCEATLNQNIWVEPFPVADFETTLRCPQLPIVFNDLSTILQGSETPTITAWEWNFGDPNASPAENTSTIQNPEHTYFVPGDYTATLEVTASNGCSDVFVLDFTIFPEFIATATGGTEICAGQSATLSASDEFDWFTYTWSPSEFMNDSSAQSPVVTPLVSTTYTVTIADPNGCYETATTTVIVNPLPGVNVDDDTTLCYGESYTINATWDADVVSFEWTGPGLSNTTDASIVVSPTETTTYYLSVIDDRACENTDSITVTVLQPITAQAAGSAEFCAGESVQLLAAGGDYYEWTPNTGLSNPNIPDPIANPTQTTEYVVLVYNDCYDGTASSVFADTDTVTVFVNPLPVVEAGPDISINVGEIGVLMGESTGTGMLNNTWTPNNASISDVLSLNPEVSPLASTTYYLSTTDDKGCINSDSVRVEVTNIFDVLIPNAFSPNNDGVNDLFRIIRTRGLRDFVAFRVFNRWGNMVFESSDFEGEWDGTHKGQALEMGVYVYYIAATTYLDEPFVHKGNITLIK